MKTEKSMFNFKGGTHPLYFKDVTSGSAIRMIPTPEHLFVPMQQHLGAAAKVLVTQGDEVKRNQLIGEQNGHISAPVHAPVAGKVSAIVSVPTAAGRISQAVIIEPNGSDEVFFYEPFKEWQDANEKAMIDRIKEAGVVGMGGAGFPTGVKLSPPPGKKIDTLIINGAECEPYLTADHRMMVENSISIHIGIEIIRNILGARTVRVAIEDNKPDAIRKMELALKKMSGDVGISVLETSYPQGAEKQQIYSVTGREVPRGGLPMDVGCVVENVSTAYAVYEAVMKGQPLTYRAITVTGDAIENPSNLWVPCGTQYQTLIGACGGFMGHASKVISGGPMMGFAVSSLDIPTTKTSSGLLCLTSTRLSNYSSQACISCGRCVDACPMRLIPSEMSQFIEAEDVASAEQLALMDCVECGNCAYVCPAHRPLVHHFRRGKGVLLVKRSASGAKVKY
ncbi:MAG: electron transport complex subunit RsxC [bacterium]